MFPKASLALLLCLPLRIYATDNKGEVLEVGDKLLIYIQHARGGPLPMDHSCAVSWRSAEPPEPRLLLRGLLLLVFNGKCAGRLLRISCGIYANASPELQQIPH